MVEIDALVRRDILTADLSPFKISSKTWYSLDMSPGGKPTRILGPWKDKENLCLPHKILVDYLGSKRLDDASKKRAVNKLLQQSVKDGILEKVVFGQERHTCYRLEGILSLTTAELLLAMKAVVDNRSYPWVVHESDDVIEIFSKRAKTHNSQVRITNQLRNLFSVVTGIEIGGDPRDESQQVGLFIMARGIKDDNGKLTATGSSFKKLFVSMLDHGN